MASTSTAPHTPLQPPEASYFSAPKRDTSSWGPQTPLTPGTPNERSHLPCFAADSYTPLTPGTPSEQVNLISRSGVDASLLKKSLRQLPVQKVSFLPLMSAFSALTGGIRRRARVRGLHGSGPLPTPSLSVDLPSVAVARHRSTSLHPTRRLTSLPHTLLSLVAGLRRLRRPLKETPLPSSSRTRLAARRGSTLTPTSPRLRIRTRVRLGLLARSTRSRSPVPLPSPPPRSLPLSRRH